jgi:hypothetical protein
MQPRASQPQKTFPILPQSGLSRTPPISPPQQATVRSPTHFHSHQSRFSSSDEEDFDQEIQAVVEQPDDSDESDPGYDNRSWARSAFGVRRPSSPLSTAQPLLSATHTVRSRDNASHHGLPLHHNLNNQDEDSDQYYSCPSQSSANERSQDNEDTTHINGQFPSRNAQFSDPSPENGSSDSDNNFDGPDKPVSPPPCRPKPSRRQATAPAARSQSGDPKALQEFNQRMRSHGLQPLFKAQYQVVLVRRSIH